MKLDEAEAAIARILRELETSYDSVVDRIQVDTIRIEDVDVTCIDDDRRQFARRVVIDLKRLPGQKWYP